MTTADLGRETERVVAELVQAGRFASEADVLREGVRLVREREARLETLDQALQRGLADADAGRTKPAAEVFDRLQAKYERMSDAQR
jgi:antitoxin ParD1/3/4